LLLFEIGPDSEIFADGEIYVDPEFEALDDPLADPLP
jgi:hypothetical protein